MILNPVVDDQKQECSGRTLWVIANRPDVRRRALRVDQFVAVIGIVNFSLHLVGDVVDMVYRLRHYHKV